MDTPQSGGSDFKSRRRKSTLPVTLTAVLVVGLVILTARLRDSTPPLTPEAYEARQAVKAELRTMALKVRRLALQSLGYR